MVRTRLFFYFLNARFEHGSLNQRRYFVCHFVMCSSTPDPKILSTRCGEGGCPAGAKTLIQLPFFFSSISLPCAYPQLCHLFERVEGRKGTLRHNLYTGYRVSYRLLNSVFQSYRYMRYDDDKFYNRRNPIFSFFLSFFLFFRMHLPFFDPLPKS